MNDTPKKRGRPPSPGGPKPAKDRTAESTRQLKERGGRRLTVNLEPQAVADLAIARELTPEKTDAAGIAHALRALAFKRRAGF